MYIKIELPNLSITSVDAMTKQPPLIPRSELLYDEHLVTMAQATLIRDLSKNRGASHDRA